jgi:hypothetical protein
MALNKIYQIRAKLMQPRVFTSLTVPIVIALGSIIAFLVFRPGLNAPILLEQPAAPVPQLELDKLAMLDAWPLGEYPFYHDRSLADIAERGALAVPTLLDHLTDRRRTRIMYCVHGSPFDLEAVRTVSRLSFAEEYDPRNESRPYLLRDLARESAPLGDCYYFTVGDICFYMLGQIVNRRYAPISMLGTEAFVLSPTQSPGLAKIVSDEWSGLTEDGYRSGLELDINCISRRSGALERLWKVAPGRAEGIIVSLLSRSIMDMGKARSCAQELIWAAPGTRLEKWREIRVDLNLREGVKWVLLDASVSGKAAREESKKVIADLFPEVGQSSVGTLVCPIEDSENLIRWLGHIESPAIIEAVQACYTAVKPEMGDREGITTKALDNFVIACMYYLQGQGELAHRFAAYCELRAAQEQPEESRLYWSRWHEKWQRVMDRQ